MSDYSIYLNTAEIGNFLKGEGVKKMVEEYAGGIRDKAGDGYETRAFNTGKRIAATVYPATPKAYYSNLKHNTLLKSL